MSEKLNLLWKAPGPIAAKFMAASKPVQILNGPIGSGKTTAACIKIVRLAAQQKPSSLDGVRKFKACVVRDTYRQLWKTTLPSWFKRFPRSEGNFVGAENGPASHTLNLRLQDGSEVHLHVDFIAIGENAVEDVMRGYEPTIFYLNEADLLAREVYQFAKGRVGRYPDMSEGGPTWYGIIMDANAPEINSWLYLDIFRDTPDDVALFRQPSGLSPHAENLENLPPGYYENQAKGQKLWYIERMIKNRPGFSRAGKPVFTEFDDNMHVAETRFAAIWGLPVMAGLDAGGSPAAALTQRMPDGQWRCFAEVIAEQGTGPRRFGEQLARALRDHCPGFRIRGYADPSAAYGADKKDGEKDWIEIVSDAAGIAIEAAPTNALIPRLEAIRQPLTRLIDGKPAFLLSPDCVMLREGFNSSYRYPKHRTGGDVEMFGDEPEKNHPHSDVMDALGYAQSGGGEDLEIRGRRDENRMSAAAMARGHVHDWEPLR